jgi:hypothetical protein
MAQGDVVAFDQFILDTLDTGVGHDFSSGNATILKCAIVDSTIPMVTTLADPCWGVGGTTDVSANEVTEVGDYTAGGNALASPLASIVGGVIHLDWGDPTAWATGTDTDAKWGIVYNDSLTPKKCICYVDLGTAFDMSTGTLTITFGTPALTLNQA